MFSARSHRLERSERAYSLTEFLLVSIVILALGSGAYSAAQTWSRTQIGRQAEVILHLIRQEARIAYHIGGKRMIRFVPGSGRAEVPRPNLPLRVVLMPKGLAFAEARFGNLEGSPEELLLRPDGTATPGSLTLRGPQGETCRVTVSLHGALRKEC